MRLRSASFCGLPRLAALLSVLAVAGALLAPADASAQQTSRDSTEADSVRAQPLPVDTTRSDTSRIDTTRSDTLQRPPEAAPRNAPAGQRSPGSADAPEEAVQFSARDSLVIVFGEDGEDVGTLYGEAEVKQQEAALSAYEVQILFGRNELRATGPPRGVAADTAGLPQFQRGEGESFTGRELSFNLDTRRGRIIEARTGYDEGFVQGRAVRVESDSTTYVQGGSYTTCNCPRDETPSYSLRSGKMKVQGDWVYTGPIQLFIYNIPTPLVLPFAFLPAVAGRHGGIIPPEYGRDDQRGFHLRDFGYYWPISDYMDVIATGSVWSRGSWSFSPALRYNRRYYYNGDLRFDYSRNLFGDVVDPSYLNRTDLSLKWTHQQVFIPQGAPNTASLRANVDLASQTYREVVSDDPDENVTRRTTSTVTFNKEWNDGNQQLSVNLRQQQNYNTGDASLTLPSLNFRQRSIKPFERGRDASGPERWYERITTRYSGDLDNSFRFSPLDDEDLIARGDSAAVGISWYDALVSQDAYRRATGDEGQRFDFGATHNIPIRATFRLPRYQLNVTPNVQYRERWFPSTQRRELRTTRRILDPGADSTTYRLDPRVDSTVVRRTESGFFAAREVTLGVSSSTTFYGQFPLRAGPLRGLRHEVQPSLSFNFEPDYSTDFFGRTRSYVNEDGEVTRYDIVTGSDLRNPGGRQSINLSLDNEFQTKQVTVDSTGAEQEEILRLMRLDMSTGYNFVADELRWDDLRVRADFPVLDTKYNIDASARMQFSPYVYDEDGRLVDRLVFSDTGFLPVRLTDFSMRVSTDFQGGDGENRRRSNRFANRAAVDRSTDGIPQVSDPMPQNIPGRPSVSQGIGQYANFEIPWSLSLDLSYGFTNREVFEQSNFLLNADFDFNLTPRWKVSGMSGYDFDRGELTRTRFNITRDFECWQMSFNWIPFGRRRSYGFNLQVKSGVLRDLLQLRLPREGVQNRFGSVVSRATQGR